VHDWLVGMTAAERGVVVANIWQHRIFRETWGTSKLEESINHCEHLTSIDEQPLSITDRV